MKLQNIFAIILINLSLVNCVSNNNSYNKDQNENNSTEHTEPSNPQTSQIEFGDSDIKIETKEYYGYIKVPDNNSLEGLKVITAFGESNIKEGSFSVRMNSESTGMLGLYKDDNLVLFNVFPKHTSLKNQNPETYLAGH